MVDGSLGANDGLHPVVDVHSHVVPSVLVDRARRGESLLSMDLGFSEAGILNWKLAGDVGSMEWDASFTDPDERVLAMDRDGIDVQLLSINPAMYGYAGEPSLAAQLAAAVNDGIAEIVAAAPERFQGLAHLPMQDGEAAARELHRAVTELGMAGAGIGTNVAGRDLDAPELRPVFETAEALGAMVFVHPSADRFPSKGYSYFLQNLIGHPVETTVAMASLMFGGVFDRYPGLRVCFAHGGGYGCMAMGRFDHGHRTREQCRQMAKLPSEYRTQVYVDTLTHGEAGLRLLVDALGIDQVVIGTDYPTPMAQADPIGWLDRVSWLTSEQRSRILSANAAMLLGPMARRSGPSPGDVR